MNSLWNCQSDYRRRWCRKSMATFQILVLKMYLHIDWVSAKCHILIHKVFTEPLPGAMGLNLWLLGSSIWCNSSLVRQWYCFSRRYLRKKQGNYQIWSPVSRPSIRTRLRYQIFSQNWTMVPCLQPELDCDTKSWIHPLLVRKREKRKRSKEEEVPLLLHLKSSWVKP